MKPRFLKYIKDVKAVLIIISQPLDFDCIGSGLLMKKYLESLGKKVLLVFPRKLNNEEKEFNQFLPYFDQIKDQDTLPFFIKPKFDLLVLLDGMNLRQFVDRSHTLDKYPEITAFPKRVHIDHHFESNDNLGTFIIHNQSASSTAEIILDQIIPEGFLDEKTAQLGYAAILGDTGNFRWKFTPKTLKIAAKLLEAGADPEIILENTIFSKTPQELEVLSYAAANLEFNHQTQTVFLTLPDNKLEKDGFTREKLEILKRVFPQEIARSMRGYPRGILIWEEKENYSIISARGSNLYNKINLPDLFQNLGGSGGGHFHACSFSFELKPPEVEKKIINGLKNKTS